MTDDRLYPPAAVYLTGALARSARQPRVDGLEGYVWFDVPAPNGDVVMMPVPEVLLKPAMPPEPEPGAWQVGDVVAHRIPMTEGGFTNPDGDDWFVPAFTVDGGSRSWFPWGALWKAAGSPPADKIRPLVPAQSTVEPVTLPLTVGDGGWLTIAAGSDDHPAQAQTADGKWTTKPARLSRDDIDRAVAALTQLRNGPSTVDASVVAVQQPGGGAS